MQRYWERERERGGEREREREKDRPERLRLTCERNGAVRHLSGPATEHDTLNSDSGEAL